MTRAFRIMWAGCTLAMIVGSSSVRADGGRIEFSGAVVEPTCAVNTTQLASFGAQPQQRACGAVAGASVVAPQTYALTVRSLLTESDDDRLLAYFGAYLLAADGNAQATLVTQTYE